MPGVSQMQMMSKDPRVMRMAREMAEKMHAAMMAGTQRAGRKRKRKPGAGGGGPPVYRGKPISGGRR